MKARLTAAPPTAPTTATVCAAIFWETTTPKREAICVRKRTKNRRALADRALVQREIGNLDQPAGEHGADREIIGLHTHLLGRGSAEREHFEAREPGPRVCQILAFLLRDRRDRAQHDSRRNRQLDRQRGEAERAADRPRGAGEPGMKLAAAGEPAVPQTVQGDLERPLQGVLCHLGDRRRGGHRQRSLHKAGRLPGERRKPAREARVFEPPHRRGQSFPVCRREIHAL